MREVFVASAVRTPVGKQKGFLREWTAPELLGAVIDEALSRIDLDPALVEDVVVGCVYQVGEQGFVLGRMAGLASRLPVTVPGTSCNRQCGSSLSAIQTAYAMIASGIMDVAIAGGCELMSKYTIMSDINGTLYNGRPMGHPFGNFYVGKYGIPNQITAAQAVADAYGITPEQSWDYAVGSHRKAHGATLAGYFKREILPLRGLDKEGNEIVRDTDEPIRPETTVEVLQKLDPLPGTKWITAGLSSTITDGASAMILMSGERVRSLGLDPLARVAGNAVVGSDPVLMLTGPMTATPLVLKKAGLRLEDIDLFEVNEAFAPVPLAWMKSVQADPEKLNVNGGALALGHPVGNSGCRISVTAIYELLRRKAKYALVTLCTGGGMAPATIFEGMGS